MPRCPAVHGWVAYLEDRALQWAALPASERDAGRLALVDHCTRALTLLPRRLRVGASQSAYRP